MNHYFSFVSTISVKISAVADEPDIKLYETSEHSGLVQSYLKLKFPHGIPENSIVHNNI